MTRVFAAALLIAAQAAWGQGQEGPWDYTNAADVAQHLPVIERYHYNDDVRALRSGQSGAYVMDDLEFILRRFPNHHAALDTMSRLWIRESERGRVPLGSEPGQTPDFWFEQAMSFAPSDGTVALLYGIHLFKNGNFSSAGRYMETAAQLEPQSAEIHYNLGLLYLRMGSTERAAEHGKLAYDLGFPLPGLRNKLREAGLWPDR